MYFQSVELRLAETLQKGNFCYKHEELFLIIRTIQE